MNTEKLYFIAKQNRTRRSKSNYLFSFGCLCFVILPQLPRFYVLFIVLFIILLMTYKNL